MSLKPGEITRMLRTYPKGILTKHYKYNETPGTAPGLTTSGRMIPYYRFTKAAAHLLSLVSGVQAYLILNKTFIFDPAENWVPGYRPNNGGGAMTLGNGQQFNLRYSDNFFEGDPNAYNNHGYGNNTFQWLALSAHEVGHINQNIDSGGFWTYVGDFIVQYAVAGNHDGAPHEREADLGRKSFLSFNRYVNSAIKYNALIELMENSVSDEYKISKIDAWWNKFILHVNGNKRKSIFESRRW